MARPYISVDQEHSPPPLCGSPTSTAQLVSPAHVRISRPDNFPHSSPGQAHTMGASESARFDFFIPDSILGSAGSCQMRRPAPSAWLLLRGMRPVLTAHVRASDVASCGALHASRKLDLVLPPFSGQAYGAGTVESCALMAAPRLLERRFSTRDTFPGRQNRLRINRGYGDHRRHLTAHPLAGLSRRESLLACQGSTGAGGESGTGGVDAQVPPPG